jgi:hypothetical protein
LFGSFRLYDVFHLCRDGSQSIQPCAGPGVPIVKQMYPNNHTRDERIKLYVRENFPDA